MRVVKLSLPAFMALVSLCLLFQGRNEGPCQGRDCSVCQCLPAKGARKAKQLLHARTANHHNKSTLLNIFKMCM
uniref:Uncharacterized protein n=1 Tax=Sander lucioperca TaxID=283035 RepID=A0A8D0DCV9_SANLU